MDMNRKWGMPTGDTFDCPPIGDLVNKYLVNSKISIDPFARNKRWATHTNDLNPETEAEFHMDAFDFIQMLEKNETKADLIIFDPPYSPRQIKELYDGIGLKMEKETAQRTFSWKKEKEVLNNLLLPGGVFLYFGWDSVAMGKTRGYEILEILLVCHGPGHNDTICTVEKKLQAKLFN